MKRPKFKMIPIRADNGDLWYKMTKEDNKQLGEYIKHLEQGQTLPIDSVSQRSELLKAFILWNNKHNGIASPVPEVMVDNYLKSL